MIVITGANGNLGQRLIRRLSGQRPLRALVRSERAASALGALDLAAPLDVRVVDYLDGASMAEACAGAEQLVHLVGIIKETANNRFFEAHVDATRTLHDAALAVSAGKILYLSILGSSPLARNPCLSTKGRAEQMLLCGDVPAVVVKVPMVLGEGDYASAALSRRAHKAVNVELRAASLEQPIYAGDVIDAIAAVLDRDDLAGVALELAGPTSLSRSALIERAAASVRSGTKVISVPLALGLMAAWVLERSMDNPPVSRAMLNVLDHDDDIDPLPVASQLGIRLTSLDQTLGRVLT